DSTGLTIRLGRGDGTFAAPTAIPLGDAQASSALTAADLNGDGTIDLASATLMLLGRGDGSFGAPQFAGLTLNWGNPGSMQLGDVNRDGVPDWLALISQGSTGSLVVAVGRGDGTFLPTATMAIPQEGRPTGLVVGDFNVDGRTDVVVQRG